MPSTAIVSRIQPSNDRLRLDPQRASHWPRDRICPRGAWSGSSITAGMTGRSSSTLWLWRLAARQAQTPRCVLFRSWQPIQRPPLCSKLFRHLVECFARPCIDLDRVGEVFDTDVVANGVAPHRTMVVRAAGAGVTPCGDTADLRERLHAHLSCPGQTNSRKRAASKANVKGLLTRSIPLSRLHFLKKCPTLCREQGNEVHDAREGKSGTGRQFQLKGTNFL